MNDERKDQDLPSNVSRVESSPEVRSATKRTIEVTAEIIEDEKRAQQLRDTLFQYVGRSVTLNDAEGPVVGEVVSARLVTGMPKDPKKLVLLIRVLDPEVFPKGMPEVAVGALPTSRTDVSTRPSVQQKLGPISVSGA